MHTAAQASAEHERCFTSCEGTCRIGERIAFNYLVSQKYTGETADVEVLRDGQPMKLSVSLARPAALVPLHLNGRDPSYFVIAGGTCSRRTSFKSMLNASKRIVLLSLQ